MNGRYRGLGRFLSLVLVLTVLCSGVALADCATDTLEGEITFWHSFTQGARMEAIKAAAEQFMQLHPQVKINIETFSWGDFNKKWNAGLTSGDLPDMSTAQNTAEVVQMINAGVLVPVDDLVDAIGRDRFATNALEDMSQEGAGYAVPYYSHAQVMWFRKDLLDKAGLEVPSTWEEFYNAAVALTMGDTYGAAFSCSVNDLLCARYLNYYVRSGGGSLLTEDLKANLTSDIALEGINFWLNVYRNCSPAETINYTVLDHSKLFYQGITAFDFNSGFMISGVQSNSPDIAQYVDCVPLPKLKAGDPDYSAEATHIPLTVWKNSAHPEVCKAFIQYLYQEDNYIKFLEAVPVGMLPALSDIKANPTYLANPTVQQFSHSVDVISQAITLGRAIGFEHGASAQASYLTSQGVIEAMFQDIITNNTDVETAAKAAEDKLNEIFDTMIG
ncbi:MAG: sugar ABC transporter substrate-binding protein [Christensenellaceae bacterium]|nr:sugar ABC transporter substrate-binding protein [Christensenellaceae bacterium]